MGLKSFFRSRWVRIPLLIVVLLVLVGAGYLVYRLGTTTPSMYNSLGVAPPASGLPLDGSTETIVYTSLRPSNWDVYLFDSLDAPPRKLTDDPNLDYNPVLSRDTRWVVFVSERDGNANLYALDLNAKGEPIALTSNHAMDDAPTLSPDGKRVAFVSNRTGNPEIFVMPFAPGEPSAETS